MSERPILVSHPLCPYVQRAAIVAAETELAIERISIDLADKPDWFLAISPTGKVPLLRILDPTGQEHVLFESAAICEYLDETSGGARLMPADPIARARTRAWVEFASGSLADIAGLYAAVDESGFDARSAALRRRFEQLENVIAGPWFAGPEFGLVDAAFGPVFRYLDVFESGAALFLAGGLGRVADWRAALGARPSVATAVDAGYPDRLMAFLRARGSHLSARIASLAQES